MVLWQRYLKLINRPHQTPTRMARDEEVKIKGDGWPESSKSSETDTEKEQKNGPELPLLLLRSLRLWTAVCVWHGKAGRGGRDFRLEKANGAKTWHGSHAPALSPDGLAPTKKTTALADGGKFNYFKVSISFYSFTPMTVRS